MSSAALRRYTRAIEDALRPDPYVTIDQWAAQHRVLPPDVPEPGPWRNARTPYLIDIMRTMSPRSPWREGYFKKGVQLGGSASGENLIGGWVCTGAGSILMVFPTLDDAKQWELTRFEPMRSSTKAIARRIRPADVKGADNTKLRKRFPGGVLRLVGSNRVGALKSSTIRYIKAEEVEEFPRSLEGQGRAWDLAKKRASNYGNKAKIYADSTPSIDGASNIDDEYKRGDQRKWHVPCPHCRHMQPLVWEQFKWVDSNPNTVMYACVKCSAQDVEAVWKQSYARDPAWTEAQARDHGAAHWWPTAQGQPGVASWHGPSFIAPTGWRPWVRLIADWLDAQGDEEKLKAFINNEKAECWKQNLGVEIAADALIKRAEPYPMMFCPQGGLVVLAGVDTQDDRFEVTIRAYGMGAESWGVWYGVIPGVPSSPEVQARLAEVLEAPIKHASGQYMRVDVACIDTGGHFAEDVYAFCHSANLRGKHWFAVKGASSYDAPKLGKPKMIDFTWRGKEVPGGVELRQLGTQAIKNVLYARLTQVTLPGAGYMHFPLEYPREYFDGLTAEKREFRKDKHGKRVLVWVNTPGNEPWDCEVYAYGAYLYLMQGKHAETFLKGRQKAYAATVQADMFDPASGSGAVANPVSKPEPTPETESQGQQQPNLTAKLEPYKQQASNAPRRPRRGFAQRW